MSEKDNLTEEKLHLREVIDKLENDIVMVLQKIDYAKDDGDDAWLETLQHKLNFMRMRRAQALNRVRRIKVRIKKINADHIAQCTEAKKIREEEAKLAALISD